MTLVCRGPGSNLTQHMSHIMRKPVLCHMQTTKAHISLCSLISAFAVHCLDSNAYTCLVQNFKSLSSLCS